MPVRMLSMVWRADEKLYCDVEIVPAGVEGVALLFLPKTLSRAAAIEGQYDA